MRHILVFIFSICVFELALRHLDNDFLLVPIDIQDPNQLFTKISSFSKKSEPKIVFIGDSVIFAKTMKDHGDHEWIAHSLPSLVENYAKKELKKNVSVLNLGMNGALPKDLEQLLRILSHDKFKFLILDIGMRAFSSDFMDLENQMSRPWLEKTDIKDGKLTTTITLSWRENIEESVANYLSNSFLLFRTRTYLQDYFLGTAPKNFFKDKIKLHFTNFNSPDNFLLTIMNTKRRYSSIELSRANSQVTAFLNSIEYAKKNFENTLIFYTKENPDYIDQIIGASLYDKNLNLIYNLIENPEKSDNIFLIKSILELQPEHYLDQIHVNEVGYKILFSKLKPYLDKFLDSNI